MVVQVNVVVKNLVLLRKALDRMKYFLAGIENYTPVTEVWQNPSGRLIHCIQDNQGNPLCGVYEHEGKYSLVAGVRIDCQTQIQSKLDEIKQQYAYEEVLDTAKRNGWRTIEKREIDGTLRIRLAV